MWERKRERESWACSKWQTSLSLWCITLMHYRPGTCLWLGTRHTQLILPCSPTVHRATQRMTAPDTEQRRRRKLGQNHGPATQVILILIVHQYTNILASITNHATTKMRCTDFSCRAWNSSRKRGFLRKWKSKTAEKYIFCGKKSTSILSFLWKLRWLTCECKLKVSNWYSSWIVVWYISSNLPPECLKLHRF